MSKVTAAVLRQKLAIDFEFWARNICKIRTKDGQIRPLVLNTVQKKLLAEIERQMAATGKIRVIILKARQQGLSTFVSAYLYWRLSHRSARKGLVVAHKADSTSAIFSMYRRIHDDVPAQLRLKTGYSNRKEIVFSEIDTGLMVATAGGDGIGRGETITDAHLSEVAFWPTAHAHDNMNALGQAIPNNPDTSIFVESTADGLNGPFYDLWQGAVTGQNGYLGFFSPWFDSDEYRLDDVPEPADGLWIEEEDLQAKYGLSWPQLAWRRQKIALSGLDKFKQEYPGDAEEAFIATGSPIFDPKRLAEARLGCLPAEQTYAFRDGLWMPDRFGALHVWHEPEAGESYWIGADVASGIGKDYSVAQVLDSKKRQVAVYRYKIDPMLFADVLYALGERYNGARIGVESNQYGYGVLTKLQHVLYYPSIYSDVNESNTQELHTTKLGFFTNPKSKPMIIGKLVESLRIAEMTLIDHQTVKEMQSFVEISPGRMGASAGMHDDHVMALAIANHIHDGRYEPIPAHIIADSYVEAY